MVSRTNFRLVKREILSQKMPEQYRKPLIWERSMELTKYADLTKEIGLTVYFCDP